VTETHKRRPRYPGKHPRLFGHKYKELNPSEYPDDVQRIRESGKTPAGTHVPIMVSEVLACLQPHPGDVVVDCTLGGGGHARPILERIVPGGRLIGLDADPVELPRTEAALRSLGFAPDVLTTRVATFAGLGQILAAEGIAAANVVFADLGVSSMQLDNPERGFSYKGVGPLDMRMNPTRGQSASEWLAHVSEAEIARVLLAHADEPEAEVIARVLKQQSLLTTHETERAIRSGLIKARPQLSKAAIKMSIRRTFQALRIAVNDEFGALDALLRALPYCLAPGGRVAIITFHSGEDRRVKKAFQAGLRAGIYADAAREVIRASMAETRANRRAAPAKLRWAVRS